jgi:hypothetical protein
MVAIGGLATTAAAMSPEDVQRFEQGNVLYQAEDYDGARDAYEALIEGGVESADVYYNLGNAAFQASDLGASIWAYLRASRLAPLDDDVAANLAFARARTRDAAPGGGDESWFLNQLAAVSRLVPARHALLLTVGAYILFVGFILTRWRTRRIPARTWISAGFVLWLGLGAYAMFRVVSERTTERIGVIVVEEVSVLNEPAIDGKTVFVLHAGTELTLERDLGGWIEVTLGRDLKGWLPADALREV